MWNVCLSRFVLFLQFVLSGQKLFSFPHRRVSCILLIIYFTLSFGWVILPHTISRFLIKHSISSSCCYLLKQIYEYVDFPFNWLTGIMACSCGFRSCSLAWRSLVAPPVVRYLHRRTPATPQQITTIFIWKDFSPRRPTYLEIFSLSYSLIELEEKYCSVR